MALTEESITRIVAGMRELARKIEARLETAQWAGTPDAIDAKRLPFVFSRVAVDRSLASGKPPQPKEMWVLGESFPLGLEVPATDAERAAVETRKREISPAVIALGQARSCPWSG
jgi:hypothetical protein